MPKPKEATSYRLSPLAKEVLAKVAFKLGQSKTQVIETAIRLYGEKFGIKTPSR